MAEEQAYHVSKGLECIKALRENPPNMEEIQEVSNIRDQTYKSSKESGTTGVQEEEITQNIDESHTPTKRSNSVSDVLQEDQRGREDNTAPVEAKDRIEEDTQTGPAVRRYYVYDHCGEKVKGIEDADSLMVPAGPPSNRGFEGREGSLDDSIEDSSEDYSEGNASSNWGYTFGLNPDRAADVSMLMEEELTALLGTGHNAGGQKRDGRTLQFPNSPEGSIGNQACEPIKKGHRREVSLTWNDDRCWIDKWCNPICTQVNWGVIRAKCICGECPPVCDDCKDDPEMQNRIWYETPTRETK
ncbi:V protein [Phocine morbillivirus]|uniref:Non-structural protein V n=2 Tax=Phocine distemper virus TaxID=11240 RepID=V_PHODV|nr:V protein [Phocine morbillivirus]P35941.1 RecName: Full=Non-structural protein V [Phocine morbillivirus]AGL33557.1 V protein [Phocine morbillivirus]CAA46485.1 V phosphoprotein [Morbillivirus]